MLDFNQAIAIQSTALKLAQVGGHEIAVAVVDCHGELLSFAKMDGAAFHAAKLARNKAYTSARDRQATSSLAAWAKETGKDLGYWTDPKFTGIAGGVPIVVEGNVIGAIGISGLAEFDDEALAKQVLTEYNL